MKLNDFTTLFNEYRLKSQIETSSQFGEQLAEVGYAFEDSIFSKWKRGTRVPKNRDLLKAIITVFVKKRAITSLEQANELLRVLNHRDLTTEEADKIFIYGNKHSPFTAPNSLTHKIAREKYLKEIVWSLMNGQITIVHGISGSGKTTIAILTAHFLKDTYKDGVLWFRGDIKAIGSILEEIGSNYGEAPTPELSNETKSALVKEILKNKDTLIIIDNVEEIEPIITYLAPKSEDKYRLLLTSIHTFNHKHELSKIKLSGFSKEEALNLSEMILGKAYVKANFDKIIDLNSKLEHSPLGITVLLKQLVEKPELLSKFLKQLNKGVFNLSSLQYDSKNLTQSLAIAYSLLKPEQQKLLSVIGVFKGTDFDTEAVAAIVENENNSVKKLVEELHQLSFIEQSRNGRYRLHPFVKIYLQSKITDLEVYKRLLEYYEVKFRPDRSDNPNTKRWILSEIENIIGAFEKCYECGQHKEVVKFWGKLCRYLWDSGRWSELDKYAQLALKSANKISDERSAASCNVKDLSWLYVWRNKLSKAEECLKTAYKYLKNHDDKDLNAIFFQRSGVIHQMKGECKKGLTALNKALVYFNDHKNKVCICDTNLYIGHCYRDLKKYEEARKYYEKSLFFGQKIRQHEGEAIALYYMGEVSLLQADFKEAERNFKRSLSIDLKRERRAGIAWCMFGLARVKKQSGDKKNALGFYIQARKMFIKLGMRQQVSAVNTEIISLRQPILID